ncbi:DUF3159 domain-containing protein [Gulosibacter macacae]|uniref:DUF3159 domain-containing protein n=1 Tax=Gulosibacter macacae TaxID=2488791 RepID=A0A3P3W849_9MICO|nr:DUF3159 domain-containing protein [Gulosibacter macacae]RRJ88833.1 DUF3159 domain-containing protein [Gulosibacter macacae]
MSESAPPSEANDQAELRERLEQAARGSALGRATAEQPGWRTFLAAMGGWRGLAEAVVPGIAFLILHSLTGNLWLSVGVPAALGVIALIVRLVRREPTAGALAGLFGMLVSGFIALSTGSGVDYFLVGLWTNLLYAAGLSLTMLVGWPAVGVIIGLMRGKGMSWRRSRRLFWWMQALTGLWVLMFVARLVVQVPLYQAGAVEALASARLIMGVPLYAFVIVITALLARVALRGEPSASDTVVDSTTDTQQSRTEVS